MKRFKYGSGDSVVAVNLTDTNVEGLVEGEVYQVIGRSETEQGDHVYAVKSWYDEATGEGKVFFAIEDRFVPLEKDDEPEHWKDCIGNVCLDGDVPSECYPSEIEDEEPEHDMVNSPKHYANRKFEAIDVIEDACIANDFSADETVSYAAALKYMLRLNLKGDPVENIDKAMWYLNRLRSKLMIGGEW